jgi:hypothetical protein
MAYKTKRPSVAWKIDAAGQRVLRDALHNCSQRRTAELPLSGARYGRGILVGVVAGIMGAGAEFDMAWNSVKPLLPNDFDRACLPDGWGL